MYQDDLAEHTMHSPVWPDYDPSFEIADDFSDWDYYSDDYYDQEVPKLKANGPNPDSSGTRATGVKRKGIEPHPTKRKRRKVGEEEEIPDLSLGEPLDATFPGAASNKPVVIWKTKDRSIPLPVIAAEHGEKVALLKDWRQRFQDMLKHKDDAGAGTGSRRRPSHKTIASHPAGRHHNSKLVNGSHPQQHPPQSDESGQVRKTRSRKNTRVEIPLAVVGTKDKAKPTNRKRNVEEVLEDKKTGDEQILGKEDGANPTDQNKAQPLVRRSKRVKRG